MDIVPIITVIGMTPISSIPYIIKIINSYFNKFVFINIEILTTDILDKVKPLKQAIKNVKNKIKRKFI